MIRTNQQTNMEEEEENNINVLSLGITNCLLPFNSIVETQLDLISNALTSLTSPIFSLFNNNNHNHHKLGDPQPPSSAAYGPTNHQGMVTLRRAGYGLLGAVYTGMMLMLVMGVAVAMAVVVVNCWVEEPVFVREKIYFDYTARNPEAVAVVVGGGGERRRKVEGRVPVGHRVHVSLMLLVPDSDYNRDLGVFQIMAEVVSTTGKITSRSSQPSMVQFHSHPIRLMRTFLMSLPLILGLTRETQKLTVPVLSYKEDNLARTRAIKVTLMPRAGTSNLPQLYEAELLMHSKLPRMKELVHSWKWTFIVWISLYIYILLLLLVFYFFKSLLILPRLRPFGLGLELQEGSGSGGGGDGRRMVPRERGFAETLRKWQQYRRRRKAEILSRSSVIESVGSMSSTSSNVTKEEEDGGPAVEEGDDVADSKSSVSSGS